MKKLLCFAAVALFATAALAGQRDLTVKGFNELPVLSASGLGAGDYVPVYDVSTFTVKKVDALATMPRVATDAVASGGASKAVTVTGVTTASDCVASINEATTNAVYVRGVVATANTVTVTLSGDPGASNADITVVCFN